MEQTPASAARSDPPELVASSGGVVWIGDPGARAGALHPRQAIEEVRRGGTDVVVVDAVSSPPRLLEALRQADRHVSLVWLGEGAPPLADECVRPAEWAVVGHRVLRWGQERARQRRELAEANDRVARWGLRDPLTNTLNRRGLEQALVRESAACARRGGALSALLIDCDDFKAINDHFGHATGDLVLRWVAETLEGAVRTDDYVARIGGDEFLVLLPNTRPFEAQDVAERVRSRVADAQGLSPGVRISVSIGLHRVSTSTRRVSELVRATQAALKLSKRSGKNRVSSLPPTNLQEERLLPSIERIVRLSDGAVVGWDPAGFSSADAAERFRDTLKRAALPELDRKQMGALAATCPNDALRVYLPVLPSTLLHTSLDALLRAVAPAVGPERMAMCIDEHTLLGDPSGLIAPLSSVRSRGILVVVDVGGFGVSCLESLVLLRPDQVRIDPERVRGVARHRGVRAVLQRFLHVCRSLSIPAIATGIDREDDLGALRDLGIDYGQGRAAAPPA